MEDKCYQMNTDTKNVLNTTLLLWNSFEGATVDVNFFPFDQEISLKKPKWCQSLKF